MAAGKTGYLDLTPDVSWAKVRIYYEETYDPEGNTSTLTVTSIQVRSASYYGVSYYADGKLMINGKTVLTLDSSAGKAYVSVSKQNTWYSLVFSGGSTVTALLEDIAHNTDGSKKIDLELTGNRFSKFGFYAVGGGYGSGWGVDRSKSLTLTTIPRASAIAATDAAIEAVSAVTVTRRSSDYTHAVAYSFGTLSGWLNADGTTRSKEKKLTASAIPFAIPEAFYDQIPSAKSALCTLTCTTYSGDSQIGEPVQTTFRVTADETLCAPQVSGRIEDINPVTLALTGDKTKCVRYASTAYCTVTAKAKNGASIASKSIGGTQVTGSTRTLESFAKSSLTFAAADSRGYEASLSVKPELVKYIRLTLIASVRRTDPTGGEAILSLRGKYFSGSFGAAENSLTLQCRVGEEVYDITPQITDSGYTAQLTLSGMDYRASHTLTVTVSDALMTREQTLTLGKGIPVFDWGENDFAFHVPVLLEQGVSWSTGLLDRFYPVGAMYISESSPAALFGGTWEAVENEPGLSLWKRTG